MAARFTGHPIHIWLPFDRGTHDASNNSAPAPSVNIASTTSFYRSAERRSYRAEVRERLPTPRNHSASWSNRASSSTASPRFAASSAPSSAGVASPIRTPHAPRLCPAPRPFRPPCLIVELTAVLNLITNSLGEICARILDGRAATHGTAPAAWISSARARREKSYITFSSSTPETPFDQT